MGMAVKKAGRGRRHRPMGEINVTPFVDVMLVLLIVFMVTAPLLTCLLYTSPSPRDRTRSRMPSSA